MKIVFESSLEIEQTLQTSRHQFQRKYQAHAEVVGNKPCDSRNNISTNVNKRSKV